MALMRQKRRAVSTMFYIILHQTIVVLSTLAKVAVTRGLQPSNISSISIDLKIEQIEIMKLNLLT